MSDTMCMCGVLFEFSGHYAYMKTEEINISEDGGLEVW